MPECKWQSGDPRSDPRETWEPLKNRAAEGEAWDAALAGAVKSHVFQTPGWARVKERMGWRVHRIAVERGGAFRAGLQILERDFPRIGRRFFYAPRGPVAGAGWEPEDMDELFSRAEVLARARKAVFLKIDPDVAAEKDWVTTPLTRAGFRKAPVSGGFSGVQPRCVFRLDIARSEEEILAGMDQKTRYNIRLAEKKGVRVRPIQSREDIAAFYRILVGTARRDGFLIRPEKYFHDIQDCFSGSSPAKAQFFLAERDGRAIAGALALTAGKTAWYAYGASADTDRQFMPNHLMQWTLIRWARDRGCGLYDFRAVPSDPKPGDPLYGLYRFKKGFGAEFTEFVGEFDRVYVPWLYWVWVKGWPLFKNIRRAIMLKPARAKTEAD